MSELSEDEIIKGITKILNECDKYFDECGTYLHLAGKKEQDLVQGLLDLYNKEKEKNKELENADLTTVYMNGFYDGEKKWKDKIKQRINEIDDTGIRTFNEQINMELKRIDNQRIEDLQELLEERI